MTVAPTERSLDPAAANDHSTRLNRRDAMTILALLALTAIVFANGLRGNFVLDDHKQIVRNELIRLPSFWITALSSDVWAFQGERDTPWSNYWRPGHVAWLIANYQLFGPNPLGWHAANLLAHLGVVASAYAFVRWLGATWGVATAIVALFAIHPTRVESVTWIAGVHDVLATLWQLLAILCLLSIWRRQRNGESLDRTGQAMRWMGALLFYIAAVSTKEIAILFPLIVALLRHTEPPRSDAHRPKPLTPAVLAALPFAVLAAAFLVARLFVLGRAQIAFPGQPSYTTVLATLPLVVAHYLRLIVFPYRIGWSYPVRAVTGQNLGWWTFWLPIAIVAASVMLAQRIVRGRMAVIGAGIFVLTLLPALNLRGLHPEQLVKDRYLYMPLLGFLMVVVPPIADALRRLFGAPPATLVGAHVLAIVVILLGVRSVQYNAAWRAELPLWQWAVRSDPASATNHELLATAYMHAGPAHYARAHQAFDRALQLNENLTDAYVNRAELALRERRFDDAADDCSRVLDRFPDNVRALERLIIARQGQGRLDDAIALCRDARRLAPYRTAVFTDKLAVLLVLEGRKDEALAELESAREQAERDFSPGSRMVLFHLGALYDELGRRQQATGTLRRFLELTEGSGEPNIVNARKRAMAILARASPDGA